MTSRQNKAIRFAKEKGYTYTEDGEIISPSGKILKISLNAGRTYKGFSVWVGFNVCVYVHRFIAYCTQGEEVFKHAVVRHIDGNQLNNRPDNLVLGSHKDNSLDIPKEERLSAAQRAGKTKALKGLCVRYMTQEDRVRICRLARRLKGKYGNMAKIARKFNVSKHTIYNITRRGDLI